MTFLRTSRVSLYGAAGVFVLGILAGCTATPSVAGDTSSAPHSSTPTPMSTSTAADDERTCAALGDVRTILFNARAAFSTDRMTQDELNQWANLASRVLGNIPSADHGPIADAVETMKATAPDGQSLLGSFSAGGQDPTDDLADACEDAGFSVVMSGFVGG